MQPPQGFPEWLIPVLAVALPWIFQTFIKNMNGTLKFLITWGISGIIAFVLVVFVYHVQGIGDILRYIGWMWACMQFVYSLFIKKFFGPMLAPNLFKPKMIEMPH